MNGPWSRPRTLHRGALRVMLASVAASALMGSYAVLREDFGETETRLLLSTLAIFGASTITLACGLAWERRRLGVVPPLGIALGLVGLVLMLVLIWGDPDGESPLLTKSVATEVTLALAATHASLIGVVGAWRRISAAVNTALGLNGVVTAMTIAPIWWEPVGDADGYWRLYGSLFVLLVAVTIAIPVLRRLQRGAGGEEREGPAARFCPVCGAALDPPGATECASCGARFEVRITVA